MRVLYLTHRVPYPPDRGDKVRSHHILRRIAARHDVTLVSPVDDPRDLDGLDVLRGICRDVTLLGNERRSAQIRAIRSIARGASASEGYFDPPGMRGVVARLADTAPFDAAWASSSAMAQFLPLVRAGRTVVDVVDVDSEKWRQFASFSPPPRRWIYALEARRVRALEQRLDADDLVFVSPEEAATFAAIAPGRPVSVIPDGVDPAFLAAPRGERPGRSEILFTGTMDYLPNEDAALFFLRAILPLVRREVPAASFTVVGRNPTGALRRAASQTTGARVTGAVPDMRPHLGSADLVVVPLRMGRGVKVKMLEAMAMGLPIVASPIAVEGLAVTPGVDVVVANSPGDFADAVVHLLRDPARAGQIGEAARRLVEGRYRWEGIGPLIDRCLDPAAPTFPVGGATT